MLELIAGVIVALVALALVLEPLLAKEPPPSSPSASVEPDFTSIEESESPKIRALLALKEIEFDRATGKLSDEDYAGLKAKYSAEAVEEIRKEEVAGTADPSLRSGAAGAAAEAVDAAEHAVQLAKHAAPVVCPACGPRPEPAAVFCSRCGGLVSRVVG